MVSSKEQGGCDWEVSKGNHCPAWSLPETEYCILMKLMARRPSISSLTALRTETWVYLV